MPAKLGETSKTTRWAFLCDERNYPLVVDALRKAFIPAAFSPLHDQDVWDRPAILNYCESWTYQRDGVLFFYDDCFDVKEGFTFKEVMQRPETPVYVVWRGDNVTAKDKESPSFDPANGTCFRELPIVGEVKKPHYHCQVELKTSMTRRAFLAQVKIEPSQVYYWEPVGNSAGLLRYYAHLDNPEKAQYRKSDVLSINGFDLSPLYRKTEASKVADFQYLYAVVRSCPAEHADLVTVCDALIETGHPEIAYALRSGAGFWKEVIYQQSKNSKMIEAVPDLSKSDFQSFDEKETQAYIDATEKRVAENRAMFESIRDDFEGWKKQLEQVQNSFL